MTAKKAAGPHDPAKQYRVTLKERHQITARKQLLPGREYEVDGAVANDLGAKIETSEEVDNVEPAGA